MVSAQTLSVLMEYSTLVLVPIPDTSDVSDVLLSDTDINQYQPITSACSEIEQCNHLKILKSLWLRTDVIKYGGNEFTEVFLFTM